MHKNTINKLCKANKKFEKQIFMLRNKDLYATIISKTEDNSKKHKGTPRFYHLLKEEMT